MSKYPRGAIARGTMANARPGDLSMSGHDAGGGGDDGVVYTIDAGI